MLSLENTHYANLKLIIICVPIVGIDNIYTEINTSIYVYNGKYTIMCERALGVSIKIQKFKQMYSLC